MTRRKRNLREKKIEVLRGGLQDFEVLKRGASETDAVIHTAFSHNFSDYNDAVELDREVIAAFAESLAGTNKPFIVTSSSAILGDTRGNEADEDYPFDENSPRRTRGEAERDVLQLSSKGIRSIVLRLPLFVYGRGGSSFVPFVINQAKQAGTANYIESGEQKVSAVHVEDVAGFIYFGFGNKHGERALQRRGGKRFDEGTERSGGAAFECQSGKHFKGKS